MASIHVVGELLGASGLAWPGDQEAFSVSHVIDLVSLHPSSEFSYFCRWRLVVSHPGTQMPHEEPSWKVIQGESRGQTQVHAASSGGSLAMPDLHRHSTDISLPKMDTVWAHPIDLHLALTNTNAWNCWPRLEFQVWSLNRHQREELRGTASVHLPMATNDTGYRVSITTQLEEKRRFRRKQRAQRSHTRHGNDLLATRSTQSWIERGKQLNGRRGYYQDCCCYS